MGDDSGKYEATFLIPKDHAQVADIQNAVKEVGMAELGKDWAKAKLCLKDGSEKDYDGYEGNWTLKAATKKRPAIVDIDKTPLVEADGKPYAGCYVNASVTITAFQNAYGKFVQAQLNGIQFAGDGEPFGGGSEGYSEDDFGVEDSDDSGDAPF
jgi:hypothetical protein